MSGNSLAMMPWFPRDFIAATRHLALAERGAYRELLDYQWEMGCLPSDHKRLARLISISAEEFAEIWPAISDKFEAVDGGIANKRLEEHRKKAIEQRDKKVNGAAKTNAIRSAERDAERVAERCDIGTPPTPSPSPSPSQPLKQEEEKSKSARHKGADTAVVQSIFVHWKTEFGHDGALLTPKRAKRISDGLKNFTAEQLRDALSGYKNSKFHMGENDEGKRYDDIELFLRTGEKIEEGLRLFKFPPRPPPEKKLLSPVERVILANGGSLANERVVSEQHGRSDKGLGDIFGDVRDSPYTGLRRIGS